MDRLSTALGLSARLFVIQQDYVSVSTSNYCDRLHS
jgi:hypothetical protein